VTTPIPTQRGTAKNSRRADKPKAETPTVYVDAEWDESLPHTPFISVTCLDLASRRVLVWLRDDVPQDKFERIFNRAAELSRQLGAAVDLASFAPAGIDRLDLLDVTLVLFGYQKVDEDGEHERVRANVAMFYNPKDVEAAVSWSAFVKAIVAGDVHRHAALVGHVGRYRIVDVSGLARKQSLQKFVASVGVAMPDKSGMDALTRCGPASWSGPRPSSTTPSATSWPCGRRTCATRTTCVPSWSISASSRRPACPPRRAAWSAPSSRTSSALGPASTPRPSPSAA
jgi:hypothetical protein